MEGRFPDFMIIGAMKCGTTSLHDYLGLHPDIFMSKVKEIHYFADDKFFAKNESWYKEQFKTEKKIAGTSPQNYTKCHNKYYKGIPKRVYEHIPDLKMIYILRDPIERYRSHILENYYGEPPLNVQYNIKTDHYLKTGLYHMQLKAWLEYFDLSQILIITLEDLKSEKLKTLNKIFKFLNVVELHDEKVFDFIRNQHHKKVLPYKILHSVPYRALNKIAPNIAMSLSSSQLLKRYIFRKGTKKNLSEEELLRLVDAYRADKLRLEKLTGLKFDKWSI